MKDYYIDNMLQELNSMSRMAVIENASVTGKMISIYSNILRYRWNEEGKQVTAEKEINIALKCCELFNLKNSGMLSYEYRGKDEVKTIFVPHYTIVLCIKKLLGAIESRDRRLKLQIEINENDGATWIHFLLSGQIDFEEVVNKVDYPSEGQGYEDINAAIRRWKEKFGEKSFKFIMNANDKEQLKISFGCR